MPLFDAELLLESHITPTFALDSRGRVVLWNRACETLTGLKALDVLGTSDHWRGFHAQARPCLADLILQDRIEQVEEHFAAFSDVQVSRGALAAENWHVLPITGRRLYIAFEAAPVRDGKGDLVVVLETVRDLTALKEAEVNFRTLAGLDSLTGISNRRSFDGILATEWRRAIRFGRAISLLIVDIDHFKQFNDSFGHPRGDECLRKVAEILACGAHRAGDVVARYGGDEFAVILPGVDRAGAAAIAEKIRAAVEAERIPHPLSSAGVHVTLSIGIATWAPRLEENLEKLVCFADVALYRAKERGRNRVSVFDEDGACVAAAPEKCQRIIEAAAKWRMASASRS